MTSRTQFRLSAIIGDSYHELSMPPVDDLLAKLRTGEVSGEAVIYPLGADFPRVMIDWHPGNGFILLCFDGEASRGDFLIRTPVTSTPSVPIVLGGQAMEKWPPELFVPTELVADYFSRPGVVAQYEYDFGDGWEHELTLEAILPRQRGKKYPLCLGGARACPPEDCGGVGGYEDLVTVIQTPTHEEHESTLRWLGGRFDPEKFDPRGVKFDDPARRYELAFEEPYRRSGRGRRAAKPDHTRLRRSRARRARR